MAKTKYGGVIGESARAIAEIDQRLADMAAGHIGLDDPKAANPAILRESRRRIRQNAQSNNFLTQLDDELAFLAQQRMKSK